MGDLTSGVVSELGDFLKSVLPVSPFADFFATWQSPAWLGWLNWFFPVAAVMRILVIWVAAISVYYIYSIIMRWIKVIS